MNVKPMLNKIKDYLIRNSNTNALISAYVFLSIVFSLLFIETVINRNTEFGRVGIYTMCITVVLLVAIIYLFFKGKTYGYGFKRLSKRRISYYVENGFIIFLLCFSLTFALINGLGYFEIIIIGFIFFTMFERYMNRKRYKLDMTRDEMIDYRTYDNERYYFLVIEPSARHITGKSKGNIRKGEKVYIYDSGSLVCEGKIKDVIHDQDDFLEVDCGEHVLEKYEVISTVADTEMMIGNKEDFMPVENVCLHALLSFFRDYYQDPEYIFKIVESLSKTRFIMAEMLTNTDEYVPLQLTVKGDEDLNVDALFTNYDELRKNAKVDAAQYRTKYVSVGNLRRDKEYLVNPFSDFVFLEDLWIRAALLYKDGYVSKAKDMCKRYTDFILNQEEKKPSTEKEVLIWARHQLDETDRSELRRLVKYDSVTADSSRLLDLLERYPLNINEYELIKKRLQKRKKLFRNEKLGYRKLQKFIAEKLGYEPLNIGYLNILSLCFVILTMFVARHNSRMAIYTAVTALVTIMMIILIRRKYKMIWSLMIITVSLATLVTIYDVSDAEGIDNIMWAIVVLFTICVFALLFVYLKKKYRKVEKDSDSISDVNTDNILYLNDNIRIIIGSGKINIDIHLANDEDEKTETIDVIRNFISERYSELMGDMEFVSDREFCRCVIDKQDLEKAVSLSFALKEYTELSDHWQSIDENKDE